MVNYALPFDGPTYVHRIGRTGRAGAKGLAFTLVRPEERRKLEFLKQFVRKAIKGEMCAQPIPSVEEVLNAKRERLFAELEQSVAEVDPSGASAADPHGAASASAATGARSFADSAEKLCSGRDAKTVLAAVLSSFLGEKLNPARYGNITPYKAPKAARATRAGFQRDGFRQGGFSDGNQMRLYVGLGRKDGFNARDIADYFSSLLNIPQRLVDRIDVGPSFSLVSLPHKAGRDILERSRRDKSLPHMHIDVKEGGSLEKEGRKDSFGGGIAKGAKAFFKRKKGF